MNEHSKEPWYVSVDLDSSAVAIVDNLGIFSEYGTTGFPEDDAKRIVACVNACAGYSTEELSNIENHVVIRKPI